MVKIGGILIVIFGVSMGLLAADDMQWKRRFYAAESEEAFTEILQMNRHAVSVSDTIMLAAYQGVSRAATAQYVFLPTTKYGLFKEGVAQLEQSIAQKKVFENVLLRLVMQVETPSFLGYNTDIESDLQFLLFEVGRQDASSELFQAQLEMLEEIQNTKVTPLVTAMRKAQKDD